MLKILREHATSWILRIFLLLLAITFVSWGGSYLLREKKETFAAKVDDTVIEARTLSDAYENVKKQYRDALGPSFQEKMLEELKLKDRVLDDLISKILILQEAKRLGFSVSDEELQDAIQSIPAFQSNGQFDQKIYERVLQLNRIDPERFEQEQRENLLISRLVNLIRTNGGKVSDDEVLDAYVFENERINLQFLKLSPASFRSAVGANETEWKEYYQKHQEEFRIPKSVQVQYLLFRPSDFEGKVQVSQDEIKRIYETKKDQFKLPKQVKLREISIHFNPQDPPDKVEEKRKKAEEILEKAKKTKDFGSLAKQVSESSTASKGGELGWIQKGTLGEPLDSIVFSMKAGDVSPVMKGPSGFMILKAEDVKEEKQKPLEEVKDQISQALRRDKARKEASRMADDAFYSLFRSRDLETYSREKSIPLKTTGFFKEGDEIPEIGRNPDFQSHALSLKVGEISTVVNIGPNFYLLKLMDKKDSRIPPLEEVREEVNRKVVDLKADEKARQMAQDLLTQIQKGKTLVDVAREKGTPTDETGFFNRTAPVIPKIGPLGESLEIIASLSQANPIPKEVLKTKDGYFVVRLSGLEPADQNKFASAKESLKRRLTSQKQEEFYQSWLKGLRANAKIEISKNAL